MLWILWALSSGVDANACVALVHEAGELAEASGQQMILTATPTGSTIELSVDYTGDAAAFGWMVVIPAGFQSLGDGDPGRFTALHEATAPNVDVYAFGGDSEEESGCGCGSDGLKGGMDSGGARNFEGGVDIVAEGFGGSYQYTVVSADDAGALQAWLDAHGWAVGGAEDTLADLVAEGGYELVLVEVAPDVAATPSEGRQLPPLAITSSSSRLYFPARMARSAGAEAFHTVIYVAGDQGARVTGWSSVEMESISGDNVDPDTLWLDTLAEVGATTPTFVRVFAGEVDGQFVTRFETVAAAEVHTLDAEFLLDQGDAPLATTVEVWEGALPLIPFGLGTAFWLRRRRLGRRNPSAVV